MERSRSEDTSEESSGLGNDALGYFQARYHNHLVNDCTFRPRISGFDGQLNILKLILGKVTVRAPNQHS